MSLRLEPGQIIAGEFLIEGPLNEGGMGALFLALQQSTGVRRALKVMHPSIVQDEKARARFTREARIGGLIPSDHVVQVISAGIDERWDLPFLVMEFLHGEDLAARVARQGPLDGPTLQVFFEQLFHALAAAHRLGIVHRDLKPENIFLATPRSVGSPFSVKILDFGIATLAADSGTRATQPIGTPFWMAPEQTQHGSAIGPPADIWALGLVAFYCVAGQPYWRTPQDVPIEMFLRAMWVDDLVAPEARARELGLTLPSGFADWFRRCLQREPSARYPDADSALPGLRQWVDSHAKTHLEKVSATQPMPDSPRAAHGRTAPATCDAVSSANGGRVGLGSASNVQPPPRMPIRKRSPRVLAKLLVGVGVLAAGGVLLAGRRGANRDDHDLAPRNTALSPALAPPSTPVGNTEEAVVLQTFRIEDGTVHTGRGLLRATRDHRENSLFLRDVQLLHLEWHYITLERYFRQPDRELVLLHTHGMGTGLNAIKNEFQFLVLRAQGEPTFIRRGDRRDIAGQPLFSSFSSPEVLVFDSDRIVLDLGFDSGKRKRSELKVDDLRVYWEDAPRVFLGEETCRMLHGEALRVCSEAKSFDEKCERIPYPGYLRGVDRLDEPGFVPDAYDRYCRDACRTGQMPAYEEIARYVCSKL